MEITDFVEQQIIECFRAVLKLSKPAENRKSIH
jgi:hypothetical protein